MMTFRESAMFYAPHARRFFERARGSDPAADEALNQLAALGRIENPTR